MRGASAPLIGAHHLALPFRRLAVRTEDLAGNLEPETGSPLTGSSARQSGLRGIISRCVRTSQSLRVHRSFDRVHADHLRRILAKYANYYNEMRTHVSLGKDAPCTRPIERFGQVVAHPILGGLHHRCARTEATGAATAATARDDVPPEIACYLHSRSAHLFSIRTKGLSLKPCDRLPPGRLIHRGHGAPRIFFVTLPGGGKLFSRPFGAPIRA
jgi:hypothetical protein